MTDLSNAIQHHRSRRPGKVDSAALGLFNLYPGLAHYWNLDEASGTRADTIGTAVFAANGSPGNAVGKANYAVSLAAASTQYLYTSQTVFNVNTDRTFQIWMYPTATCLAGTQRAMASVGASPFDNTPTWFMGVSLNGQTAKLGIYQAGAVGYVTGTTTLSANTWYHVVYVRSGTNVAVYLNGTLELGASLTETGNYTYLYIGTGYNATWDGMLDEAAYWNRALSSTEIASLYNGGAGVPYSDLGGPSKSILGALPHSHSRTAVGTDPSIISFGAGSSMNTHGTRTRRAWTPSL